MALLFAALPIWFIRLLITFAIQCKHRLWLVGLPSRSESISETAYSRSSYMYQASTNVLTLCTNCMNQDGPRVSCRSANVRHSFEQWRCNKLVNSHTPFVLHMGYYEVDHVEILWNVARQRGKVSEDDTLWVLHTQHASIACASDIQEKNIEREIPQNGVPDESSISCLAFRIAMCVPFYLFVYTQARCLITSVPRIPRVLLTLYRRGRAEFRCAQDSNWRYTTSEAK